MKLQFDKQVFTITNVYPHDNGFNYVSFRQEMAQYPSFLQIKTKKKLIEGSMVQVSGVADFSTSYRDGKQKNSISDESLQFAQVEAVIQPVKNEAK